MSTTIGRQSLVLFRDRTFSSYRPIYTRQAT